MLRLTAAEQASPVWEKIRDLLTKRLATLRTQNDNPQLPVETTQAIRGQISAIKFLLTLDQESPPIE